MSRVISVKNSAIYCGSVRLPIILVTLSEADFLMKDIINEVYSAATNMTATAGAYSYNRAPGIFSDLPDGDHVYGDDTAFKLTYSTSAGHGFGGTRLYFKGTLVSQAGTYYAIINSISLGFVTVYMLEDGTVCSCTTNGVSGIAFDPGPAEYPGIAIHPPLTCVATINSGLTPAIADNYISGTNMDITPYIVTEDPYDINGHTHSGGGDGVGYVGLPQDHIDFPELPAISATDAGFISIWTPTLAQVQKLAQYLWTTDITKSAFWKNLVSNPLELIFGLMIMPVPIDRTVVDVAKVTLGWINTGITMDYLSAQYIDVDFGYIDVEECWGAFLDYEPYTKAEIYLPYIGAKEINVNEIMNGRVSLMYRIDLSSGSCLAMIKITRARDELDSVLYQFSGNCADQIPVSAVQMQEIFKATLTVAVGVGATIAAGAIGASATAGTAAATKATAAAAMTGTRAVADGFNSAMSAVQYAHTGSLSAAAGIMGVQDAYLIFSRPEQAMPENQSKYTGYPSFITEKLSDLTGYTEVEAIHLEGISCTKVEYDEIESLLYSGVIL